MQITNTATKQQTSTLPVLRGELALLVVVIINSLGVVLMLHSGSGISAISSVPYAFSEVFPALSLGKVIGWIGDWMDAHVRFVSFML